MNRAVITPSMVALALLAGASLVLAAGGTNLDETAHAHRAHNPASVHATTPAPCDDAPCTLTRSGNCPPRAPRAASSSVSPATPRTPQAPAPASDHRDKNESGRQAPATAAHLHRPVTQRSKTSVRSAPATPGMGFLLRIGTGAGPELSLIFDDVPLTPLTLRPGRAPPRGPTFSNLARDPIACAAAIEPRRLPARVQPPGAPLPNHPLALGSVSARPARRSALCGEATERVARAATTVNRRGPAPPVRTA